MFTKCVLDTAADYKFNIYAPIGDLPVGTYIVEIEVGETFDTD